MLLSFSSSEEGLNFFVHTLTKQGTKIQEIKTIQVSAGKRFVYQKQIWTKTHEVYHIKYWNNAWIPLNDDKVFDFAKPWNERLKYVIRTFGNNDPSASGLNESTLLNLMYLIEQGYEVFLITMYKSGEILWCRVDELYNFATQFALIPEYSQNYGEPFCWIPTGWLKSFHDLIISPPKIIS